MPLAGALGAKNEPSRTLGKASVHKQQAALVRRLLYLSFGNPKADFTQTFPSGQDSFP
eukprot:CAMPEP_0170594068 /NCGR_PEP_ID=MMETSP0224-20130122/13796_1 /TAXON_ID=285029 /ORGANISM="Togula jolla, Strain CCCM 725" /LENGTH=57 /DNA_ID=CAMNT_0010918087 /DNA_START=293 /DNA_END=463 /DNA_ORIENTATION=+